MNSLSSPHSLSNPAALNHFWLVNCLINTHYLLGNTRTEEYLYKYFLIIQLAEGKPTKNTYGLDSSMQCMFEFSSLLNLLALKLAKQIKWECVHNSIRVGSRGKYLSNNL
ncbi:hypothetical protein DOY81_011387 [Sarcophaga bullata]|nr:hypothetical protein DOY81_011387 [Sarcophaga bullata]